MLTSKQPTPVVEEVEGMDANKSPMAVEVAGTVANKNPTVAVEEATAVRNSHMVAVGAAMALNVNSNTQVVEDTVEDRRNLCQVDSPAEATVMEVNRVTKAAEVTNDVTMTTIKATVDAAVVTTMADTVATEPGRYRFLETQPQRRKTCCDETRNGMTPPEDRTQARVRVLAYLA